MTDKRMLSLAKRWANNRVCSLSDGEAVEYHKRVLEMLQNGGWISVKDRLPERPPDYFKEGHWWMVSDEDFIVADADGKVYEAHWTYGCSANNYFWYVNSLTPLKNITHWMPLSEPPKEIQHDN